MDIDEWAKAQFTVLYHHGESALDHRSAGIYPDYLNASLELSRRELTDEELEEINRIGDQVKMLQQTLKYWLQICRDEQMAIARNI